MPRGYHPNVAAPGGSINFVWMMAAHREDVDRQYGVVNVQPDFAAIGSGLDGGENEEVSVPGWTDVPVERIAEGIERQMVWGERLMVCRLTIAPLVVTPVHSHPHEQITIVERGRVALHDRRRASAWCRRATCSGFPSGVEHGATMLDEEVVLIDIFTPVREDFLAGRDAER